MASDTPTVEALTARVAELERELETARNDILTIDQEMSAAAENNDLCSEYEDTVYDTNALLRGPVKLQARYTEQPVTVHGMILVPFTWDLNLAVPPRNHSSPRRLAGCFLSQGWSARFVMSGQTRGPDVHKDRAQWGTLDQIQVTLR
jgi:hypothetical protein